MTKEELAKKIKAKYPQYKNVNDVELADKIIAKYPVYKQQITASKPKAEPAKKSTARKVVDFVAPGVAGFGETLGGALAAVTGTAKKAREIQEQESETTQMILDALKKESDPTKQSKLKEMLKKNLGQKSVSNLEDIIPETKKTGKQIAGEAIGTAATFASYGKLPGAIGAATKAPSIGKGIMAGAKQGAKIGGIFGTAQGVSSGMMEDKSVTDIAKQGLAGGAIGTTLGGVTGGITGGISGAFNAKAARKAEIRKLLSQKTKTLTAQQAQKKAGYTLTGDKIAKDKSARTLIRGIEKVDDADIVAIKSMSGGDKTKAKKMLDMAQKAKSNRFYLKRSSDVVGETIVDYTKVINKANKTAGKQLDTVAKGLKGKPFDFTAPINEFSQSLDDMGVKVNSNGKLNFKGSNIEGVKSAENLTNKIWNRLKGTGIQKEDAYTAHQLKKFIDENVAYGKSAEGLTGKTVNIVKQLRHTIDSQLDNAYSSYNKVNTEYADTISILNEMAEIFGKKFDINKGMPEVKAGQVANRILGNSAKRGDIMNMINILEKEAVKRGGTKGQSILSQVVFVDMLEEIFGTQATRSLQGQVARGTKGAVGIGKNLATGNVVGAATTGIETVADHLMKTTEADIIKALINLIQ